MMEPESPLRHTKHIFRVFLLLILIVVVLFLGRSFFVPDTWGQYGPYRAASVPEFMALPVRHEGDEACETCHDDEYATHAGGGHHAVRCELCHAPYAMHIADDEMIAEMPIRREAELCLLCHLRLEARPGGFPQIEPRQHVEEQGGEYGPAVCFDCHDPHAPL